MPSIDNRAQIDQLKSASPSNYYKKIKVFSLFAEFWKKKSALIDELMAAALIDNELRIINIKPTYLSNSRRFYHIFVQ